MVPTRVNCEIPPADFEDAFYAAHEADRIPVGIQLTEPLWNPGRLGHLSKAGVFIPAGVTPPAAAGSAGTTVGGVACKPGVRQVSWSQYAPECVPAYHGDNGGASSPGVTRTTISLAYRLAASTLMTEIYALFPKTMLGTNDEALSVLSALTKVFNRSFELYGRHVVGKPFDGQGNFMSELMGGGQEGAVADAATEKSMGTFIDDSVYDATQIYANDLASNGIV